jgi:hypothetical protein
MIDPNLLAGLLLNLKNKTSQTDDYRKENTSHPATDRGKKIGFMLCSFLGIH